jgi:hypothetical protein
LEKDVFGPNQFFTSSSSSFLIKIQKYLQTLRNRGPRGEERGVPGFKVKKVRS